MKGSPNRLDEAAPLRFAGRVKTETIVLLAAAAYLVFAAKSARADTGYGSGGSNTSNDSNGTDAPGPLEWITTIGDKIWGEAEDFIPTNDAPDLTQ